MEYMLLHDGTVKVFSPLLTLEEVLDALVNYGGTAYYWEITDSGWRCATKETRLVTDSRISISEVPEIVLLAQMLE